MSKLKNAESLLLGEAQSEDSGIFGCEIEIQDAELNIIPVPWDVTVSYGTGASSAPEGILGASHQLDLQDLCFGRPYLKGISMLPIPEELSQLNIETGKKIELVRQDQDTNGTVLNEINSACAKMNDYVYRHAKHILSQNKIAAVLGGDHSCPFGLIKALSEKYNNFSILHVDAHFDLRLAYEGFQWSHASIMRNVMDNIPQVNKLVQIGIRDFCYPEMQYAETLGERSSVFYSRDLHRDKAFGISFADTVKKIVSQLSEYVYISFDIDGLDPTYCPNTGTPVAGGLSFDEGIFLIEELITTYNKKVIGFDLCEVVHKEEITEYDSNVGARILYKLCGSAITSM